MTQMGMKGIPRNWCHANKECRNVSNAACLVDDGVPSNLTFGCNIYTKSVTSRRSGRQSADKSRSGDFETKVWKMDPPPVSI